MANNFLMNNVKPFTFTVYTLCSKTASHTVSKNATQCQQISTYVYFYSVPCYRLWSSSTSFCSRCCRIPLDYFI